MVGALEGVIVEDVVCAFGHLHACSGQLLRAVPNPLTLEVDGITELIDVCEGGLDQLYADI